MSVTDPFYRRSSGRFLRLIKCGDLDWPRAGLCAKRHHLALWRLRPKQRSQPAKWFMALQRSGKAYIKPPGVVQRWFGPRGNCTWLLSPMVRS